MSSKPDYLKSPLLVFLRNHKATTSYTHTSIGNPAGSYSIPPSDYDEFTQLYIDHVFNKNLPAHLTEGIKDIEFTPLKIDMDFRYYSQCESPKRLYTIDHIIRVCYLYMKFLDDYFDYTTDEDRDFYILEKPSAVFDLDKSGNFKLNEINGKRHRDGVHIMAPSLVTNSHLQQLAREYVYKNSTSIFEGFKFDNSFADIFDKAVIDVNNWQMYGSSKPNCNAYKVTKIIRINRTCDGYIPIEIKKSHSELVSILSVRNKLDYTPIKQQIENLVFPTSDGFKREVIKSKSFKSSGSKKIHEIKDPHELKLVCDYVDCLDKSRASSYKSWIEVGWALHNIHNKDDTLLNKWIEFSKLDKTYAHTAEDECRERWQCMNDDGLSIGSLKLWAKKDDIQKYQYVQQHDLSDKIIRISSQHNKCQAYDTAQLMRDMYGDYFKCVSNKSNIWYYYDEKLNKWLCDDGGITLKKKISTDVYMEVSRIQIAKQQQSCSADDTFAAISQKLTNFMGYLKDTTFKNKVMEECKEIFYDYDQKFLERLDSYDNLIGFNNGVYDLKTEEFRQGRPEDLISLSTKINYIEYDQNNSDVQEIFEFYKKVFVIESVREYILLRTSSYLSGTTKDEQFDVFSGIGGNGKSKHMELVENCLGEYCCKLPVSLLTQKRANSNAASPEVARTKGKRLATLQEPDEKTRINVGLMKELTGGDTIQARALFKEPIEFKPQFKMVLCCNDKPALPQHDEGVWRRVRCVEFISKFRKEIDPSHPLEFKLNNELSDKIKSWVEPYMSILIHYHKKYKKYSIAVPDEILQYTGEYREIDNHFKEFITDKIEEEPSVKNLLSITEIYKAYKQWAQDNNIEKNKLQGRKELQSYFNDKYNNVNNSSNKLKGYRGIRIKRIVVSYNDSESTISNTSFKDELDD